MAVKKLAAAEVGFSMLALTVAAAEALCPAAVHKAAVVMSVLGV
jgi:hypothetical protein